MVPLIQETIKSVYFLPVQRSLQMFNIAPRSYIVRSKKNNFNVLINMHVRLWTDHSNTYKFCIIVQWCGTKIYRVEPYDAVHFSLQCVVKYQYHSSKYGRKTVLPLKQPHFIKIYLHAFLVISQVKCRVSNPKICLLACLSRVSIKLKQRSSPDWFKHRRNRKEKKISTKA